MEGKRVQIDSKVQRKCRKTSFVGGVDDRVSQLPDDILADILSRLSLKEAGRTSVLSSRWMNLWKHTNSLNFDTKRESHKHYAQRKLLKRDRRKYVKWVNSVLRSHKSTVLKEFRIRFPLNASDRNTITQWLEFALSRQVQKLELDIQNYYDPTEEYCFPNGLLIPSSCRASKLQPPSDNICIDHHPCMLFDFKSLKALSFKSVGVSDGDINFFLDNCPQLEQLIVSQSKKLSKPEICGSSLKLKHLELVNCCGLESLKFKWFDALSRRDREVKDAIKILHRHLKVFKFCGYYGATNDVELLSYILGNCVVLEKIIIDPYFTWSRDKLQVEETARNNAKQKLAPQVPQHIELVIL
ncbi:hypothetical protein MIMGU_mgv1a009068mg [Erythranthe guttata]|uniref:F-box domain-containing protein n=1 Tax=Erythranthe guttata TaxID=4155 RepID=A0A022RPC1_ERYGU|nr:hypothetical protein MIMGU_mgv1a009068mg [Erythranthe guttata]